MSLCNMAAIAEVVREVDAHEFDYDADVKNDLLTLAGIYHEHSKKKLLVKLLKDDLIVMRNYRINRRNTYSNIKVSASKLVYVTGTCHIYRVMGTIDDYMAKCKRIYASLCDEHEIRVPLVEHDTSLGCVYVWIPSPRVNLAIRAGDSIMIAVPNNVNGVGRAQYMGHISGGERVFPEVCDNDVNNIGMWYIQIKIDKFYRDKFIKWSEMAAEFYNGCDSFEDENY